MSITKEEEIRRLELAIRYAEEEGTSEAMTAIAIFKSKLEKQKNANLAGTRLA